MRNWNSYPCYTTMSKAERKKPLMEKEKRAYTASAITLMRVLCNLRRPIKHLQISKLSLETMSIAKISKGLNNKTKQQQKKSNWKLNS